ncbi:competence protein CoiA family protein [Mesorhizobium sp. NPDC059025]|uniref:competence protein CoiA family protein n=1 Tax=unclassified Mesorhizobium TaxID=325217 RepID=UPI0036B186BE
MDEHSKARKVYGTEQARLVYGQRLDGTLAHIREVLRGLACGCVCPACRGRLVARLKDDHQVPHFAHHSGEACGGGPETALHLLAKEVFRDSPKMFVPERIGLDEQKQVVTKPTQEIQTEFLRLEYTDLKKIVPDLYVRAFDRDLFIEVAVTHFCDAEKVQKLRMQQILALEIDLSRLPRDSTREDIADAVLRTAPRQWLFHPGIDAAHAKLKQEADDRQKQENRRLADAVKRRKPRVNELVSAYAAALMQATEAKESAPRYDDLAAIGLADHIGVNVDGFGCFAVSPASWQATILGEIFHDNCLGTSVLQAVPITGHLEKRKLIRPPFHHISREIADDVSAIEPRFAPPWKAVDHYLKHLIGSGILVRRGRSLFLASAFADQWDARAQAEARRVADLQAAVEAVDRILGALPQDERGVTSSETWLQSIATESGWSYRDCFASDGESKKILQGIEEITAMMDGRGPLPRDTMGLPLAAQMERRKIQMAEQAEEHRRNQLLEARRRAHDRGDRLCRAAEKELNGPDLVTFLHSKVAGEDDRTPLEIAQADDQGLYKAFEALEAFGRRRRAEAAATETRNHYQAKITADARQFLSEENAQAFLNGRDDDLGRMNPLSFVKDESTYRKACAKLKEWEREFGPL